MLKLQVFVSGSCWTSEEAQRVVADIARDFPDVSFELVDIQNVERPAEVFAVPTYLLNGKVIFLGNPTRQELRNTLTLAGDGVSR